MTQMTPGFKPFTVIHFSLDISTIKGDYNVHCAVKTVFYVTLGYFLRTPDNSNLFRFPLKVRVIGSRLYVNQHTETAVSLPSLVDVARET